MVPSEFTRPPCVTPGDIRYAIEPMRNQGMAKVKIEKDGWTVVIRNGKLSAQFEHTVPSPAMASRADCAQMKRKFRQP